MCLRAIPGPTTRSKSIRERTDRSVASYPTPLKPIRGDALPAWIVAGHHSDTSSSTKNRAYGNSALDPIRVFSKADPISAIDVRIDDKLSRIKRGGVNQEDTELDLIGYLVLRRIARRALAEPEVPRV